MITLPNNNYCAKEAESNYIITRYRDNFVPSESAMPLFYFILFNFAATHCIIAL